MFSDEIGNVNEYTRIKLNQKVLCLQTIPTFFLALDFHAKFLHITFRLIL